jgi:hypothetical protein
MYARVEHARGTPGAPTTRPTSLGTGGPNRGDSCARAGFSISELPRDGRATVVSDAPTVQRAIRAACRSSSSSEWIDALEKSKLTAPRPTDASAPPAWPVEYEMSPSKPDLGPVSRSGHDHSAIAAVRPGSGLDSCANSIEPPYAGAYRRVSLPARHRSALLTAARPSTARRVSVAPPRADATASQPGASATRRSALRSGLSCSSERKSSCLCGGTTCVGLTCARRSRAVPCPRIPKLPSEGSSTDS